MSMALVHKLNGRNSQRVSENMIPPFIDKTPSTLNIKTHTDSECVGGEKGSR